MDLGFSLLPNFEKLGYGYESSIKVMEVAKDLVKLETLCAITMDTNHDSQSLLRKLGFSHTKMIHLNDDPQELMYFEKRL